MRLKLASILIRIASTSVVCIMALSLTAPTIAETTIYSRTRTTINCGVLVLHDTSGKSLPNPDPFVFYVMDQRRDIKPAGWVFDNPQAPSIAGPNEIARWSGLNALGPNARIRKDMAPYWEVDIANTSDENLSRYDILLLHTSSFVYLSAQEREKLRRFTDAGGLLWVDYTSGMNFDSAGQLFLSLDAANGGGTNLQIINFTHPLLSSPYLLYPNEALNLGTERVSLDPSLLQAQGIWSPIIATNGGSTALTTATYGSGHVVVTSTNVSSKIDRPVGITGGGLFAGTNFLNAGLGELKLSFNMVRWANAHQTSLKNARHSNGNFESIGAPLAEKWTSARGANGPVAIYNGIIFSINNGILAAYDALPNRDLDGDGNSDDGARKGSSSVNGAPLQDSVYLPNNTLDSSDLIWSFDLSKVSDGSVKFSAPTVVDISTPGSAKGARPLVILSDDSGTLYAFNPLPMLSNGLLSPLGAMVGNPLKAPSWLTHKLNSNVPDPPASLLAPTPTYSEGVIYVTAPYGVYVVRAQTNGGVSTLYRMGDPAGNDDTHCWAFPSNLNGQFGFPPPITPATVGYVNLPGSPFASDKVAYYGTVGNRILGSTTMRALWIGTKGEAITSGDGTFWRTRAANGATRIYDQPQSSDPIFGYVVRDVRGNIINGVSVSSDPSRPGQFEFAGDKAQTYYADYTVSWDPLGPSGNPVSTSAIQRTFLTVPDIGNGNAIQQQIQGAMTLGEDGSLSMLTDGDTNPGSLFVFRETSNNQTQLVYRWQIPGTPDGTYEHQVGADITNIVGLPAVNPITGTGPALPMQNLHFYKNFSTAQRKGIIFALAKGDYNGLPCTLLMAFDANPPAFDIRLPGALVTVNNGFLIRQPDLMRAVDPSKPSPADSYTTLDPSQYTLDRLHGIVRIKNFILNGVGTLGNAVSVSQPVGIQYGGGTESIYYPDAVSNSSHWNPLLWYMAIPFFEAGAPPMLSGDTIYLAGAPSFPGAGGSLVYAFDSDIAPNDSFLVPVKLQNSLLVKQMTVGLLSSSGMKVNPHMRWPAGDGITSIGDFIKKIRNYIIPGKTTGLVGSEGILALSTDVALRTYERSMTLIADSGRVLEVDTEGFPTMSIDSTLSGQNFAVTSGTDAPALGVKATKLVQPTKVYRITQTEMMIVDTGDNRVVRVNRSGFETRSITNMIIDSKYNPVGYNPGDPLSLRQPRDATFWTDYVPAVRNPFSGANPLEYWVHYLVADSGNNRIIELVDRYLADPNTRAVTGVAQTNGIDQVGVLFWQTPASQEGKKYSYTALQRLQTNVDPNGFATYSYVMAFGNTRPERASIGLDNANGTLRREEASGSGGILIQGGGLNMLINKIRYSAPNGTKGFSTVVQPIHDPTSIEVRLHPGGSSNPNVIMFDALIATADGVFECQMPTPRNPSDPSNASNPIFTTDTWDASLALSNDDYTNGLRGWISAPSTTGGNARFLVGSGGVPFRSASARYMANGDIMITNSWSGRVFLTVTNGKTPRDRESDFFGEVFTVNYGDYNSSAPFHGWRNPIGAGPGAVPSFKQTIPPLNNTYGLKQPQFSDRPF